MIDLSSKSYLKGVRFWTAEINQLYHPTGAFQQDSQDLVYGRNNINTTKFSPILLKEWFYLLELNGYLVIDYEPNSIVNWQRLEEQMWWLWRGKYEIIFHGPVKSSNLRNQTAKTIVGFIKEKQKSFHAYSTTETDSTHLRFICKKTTSTLIEDDSIDKWTFGIITNGKRMDWLESIIDSIRKQKILNYEIVICGSIPPRTDKDIKYLPFSLRDDRGWITRKKNIIAKNAKYENLCIVHDRLVFSENWYRGMKRWGNCFDFLSCQQSFQGKRINDWEMHEELPGLEFSFVSLLDYRDWDLSACEGGQLHILKKTFANEVLWNETFYWGRPEDLRISNDLRDHGHILRFNPNSSFDVLAYRFGDIPQIPYDTLKLSKKRIGEPIRLVGRNIYRYIYRYKYLQNAMINMFKVFSK